MKQTQRHDAIIELVKKQGYVSTEELVEQFAVSPQTIRRDLNDLADQNRILRHHGGAALPSSSVNTSWHDRKATQTAEKERIARKVASQIPNGATLFIDIGTTPEAVAHALLDHENLRVVTNNLNKAYFLRENDPVFNGYVVKITGDSVVFQETIQDKLGKSFTREVVKRILAPAV